ncbi:unnamed protein product [Tilletia caries]|nr:unnamed protein product [Tilletia caries]
MPLPTPTPSVRKSSRANERPGIAAMRPITDSPQSSRTQSTFGGGKGAPRRTLDRDIPTLEEDDHDSSYEDDDDDQYVDEQDTDARFSDNETERQYHARQGSRQPGSSDAPMGLLAPSARGLAASAMEPGFPSHPGTMRRTASSQTHDRLTARDSARDVRAQRVEPQEYSYLENGRDPMMSEKKSRRPASIASRSSSAADFYRRTQAKTDLNFWEPSTRVAQISRTLHGPISNLPDWTSLRGTELTSHPVSHVQQDVEYSIMRLISPAVFEQFLSDPLGRHRFREYLNTFEDGATELDFALDVKEHVRSFQNLRQGSEALHSVYVKDPESRVELPSDLDASLLGSLRTTFALQHQLDGVHSYLMQTLFNSAFQRFIQASITEQSRVRLGAFASDDNGDGLGAAFVLTNPRLRDHPIVLVSPAFCDLTGYPQEAILQRNCRFLQGPSTSPASVQRIRDALNSGALIKRDKREVLFVTSTLLQYFDLPTETLAQIYESPLLHADLLSLICGEDRSETRRVRANVQDAIRTGKTLKIAVKIRQPARSLFGSGAVLKSSVLHISPMKDVENNPSAAIVVFA